MLILSSRGQAQSTELEAATALAGFFECVGGLDHLVYTAALFAKLAASDSYEELSSLVFQAQGSAGLIRFLQLGLDTEVLGLPHQADRVPASVASRVRNRRRARPACRRAAHRRIERAMTSCPLRLTSNAVRHSNSGKPGEKFSVRIEVHERDYLWVEVEDEGSPPWTPRCPHGETWHGLNIVRQVAGEDNWGVDGCTRGWVVWARLDWPGP